ncbi:MAG TPA: hypothetical protein VLI39_18360 [Sedimentisphaerales bacterium]|nr:hypothetical protein [Sedimentisphaerales bacterium]
MDKRQLIIVGGIVVLGLLLAFPLSWIFSEQPGSSGRSPVRGANYQSSIRQTDDGGTEWALTQTHGLPSPKDANGVQGKPVIVVKTDVFRAREREMLIGLVLAGREGQRYSPVVVKAGTRLSAPRLRIVDEAGKVVLDDSFRYG